MMKKISVLVATLLMASPLALACPGSKNCKDGQCPLSKVDAVSALQLEGDKAQKVKEIEARHHADIQAFKAEMHKQEQALKARHHAEMAEVLTPAELAQLTAVKHAGHTGEKEDRHQ